MSAARVLCLPGTNVILPQVWAMASARTQARSRSHAGPIGRAVERIGPGTVIVLQPVHVAQPAATRPIVPELAFYRKYTEALLARYMKLSMEAGRVPSLLGRELFNGHVTSYNKVSSFEDVVVFVHDMERCLGTLTAGQQLLIKRIALQGHSQGEAAALLGLRLRTVARKYAEAIDDLTRTLLERELLEPLKSCQGVEVCG